MVGWRTGVLILLASTGFNQACGTEWQGIDRKIAEYFHYFPAGSYGGLRVNDLFINAWLETPVGCVAAPANAKSDKDVTDETVVRLPLKIKGDHYIAIVKPGNGKLEPGEDFDNGEYATVPLIKMFRPGMYCLNKIVGSNWVMSFLPKGDPNDPDTNIDLSDVEPNPSPTPKPPTKAVNSEYMNMLDVVE